MSKVNPPSALKIPAKLLADKELRDYFEQRDFIQYQLWLRTGGQTDLVASKDTLVATSQAQLNELNNRIGSGDFVTGDTTGFTGDTTKIYGDRTET